MPITTDVLKRKRVEPLVVADRLRVRDEHGRNAGAGQLGEGQRARSGNRQSCGTIKPNGIIKEWRDVGADSARLVALADVLHVTGTGLVDDPPVGKKLRHSLDATEKRLVERQRSLAPAQHDQRAPF